MAIGVEASWAERTNAIRVRFTGTPVAFDPAGYTDATNPRNYTVVRTPLGFAPTVSRVVQLSATDFRLELDTALEASVAYDVTISDRVGDADALVVAPIDPLEESTVADVFHADDYTGLTDTWANRKDPANPFRQTTPADKPVAWTYHPTLGGRKVLEFTGASWMGLDGAGEIVPEYFLIAGLVPAIAGAKAWYSTRAIDQDLVTGGTQAGNPAGPTDLYLGFLASAGAARPFMYGQASPVSNVPTTIDFTPGTPHVFGYRVQGLTSRLYRDKRAGAIVTHTFVDTNPRVGLLGLDIPNGDYFEGLVRVVLIGVGNPPDDVFDSLLVWAGAECGLAL